MYKTFVISYISKNKSVLCNVTIKTQNCFKSTQNKIEYFEFLNCKINKSKDSICYTEIYSKNKNMSRKFNKSLYCTFKIPIINIKEQKHIVI